jgi:hypothetical protein
MLDSYPLTTMGTFAYVIFLLCDVQTPTQDRRPSIADRQPAEGHIERV